MGVGIPWTGGRWVRGSDTLNAIIYIYIHIYIYVYTHTNPSSMETGNKP